MKLKNILTPETILVDCPASSQKQVFETASKLIARQFKRVEALPLFEALLAREKLGSTSLGYGIAIPHCKLEKIEKPLAAVLLLSKPISYTSLDDKPVDLFFILVIPEHATEEHLQLLADIAGMLDQEEFRDKLRACPDNVSFFEAISSENG